MKAVQLIISTIIYFLCCQIILNSAGARVKELFAAFDSASIIALAIIIIPPILAVISLVNKKKNSQILTLILSLLSVGLITINARYTNLRGLNESVTIISTWRSGMPKEIKYNEYSNKEHLVTTSYHENGNISKRVDYRNGVKSGNEITFNQNASVKKIKHYASGELIAEYDYKNLDSKIEEELPKVFDEVEKNDLSSLSLRYDQIVSMISPCCPQDYVLTQFHENGKVKTKEVYKNDKLNGEYLEFYENGNIKVQGKKRLHDKIGNWKYFDETGKLIEEETYDETGLLIKKTK